jgi:hypothetical protein
MSGTFVASATRASEKIAYFLTAQNASQNVTFSTITAQSGTFSNISTQNIEITSGKIGTGGGRFISTIANQLYYWDGTELEQLTSVSSISSLSEWSLEPAISDVNIDGNNIINVNILECGNVSSLMGEFQSLYAKDLTAETVTVLSTIQTINYISTLELRANSGLFNTISSGNAYVGNLSGNVANFNTISSGSINVPGFNTSSITVQNLSSITGYIQALQVSSINGSEFTSNTVTVSSINTSQIIAQNVSSATATLAQAFLSTVSFNPSFSGNLGPNISVDMGMGDFVGSVLGGLIGVGVTVPAGIFAIIGGLVSLIAPRPINNINNNVYEQINMTTQLQVSTLGEQFSTIFRGLSSTVSTIAGNPETVNFEVFTSTISSPPPVVAMRSVGDPLQLVSTPWTEYQAFSQWVEIPSGSVGSNLNLSTLTLLQSTILRADPGPGGILQVLEAQAPNSYGQVEAQAYSMGATVNGSNGILYYQDLNDRPGFLNNSGTAFTLAYTSDIPGAENLAVTLSNGNSAGGCNINMNSNSITNVNSIGATPVGAFGGAVTGFRTYTIANPTDTDFATVNYTVTDTARFPSTIGANRGMLFHNEPDTINEGYIGYDRVEMNDGNSTGLSRMTFSNVEVSYGPPGLNRTMRMFAAQGTGEGWVEASAFTSTATLLADVYARLDVNNTLDPNVTLRSAESGSQIANPGILQVQLDKRTLTHNDARVSPSSFLISTNTTVEITPNTAIIASSASLPVLRLENITASPTAPATLEIYTNKTIAGATADLVGAINFFGENNVGTKTQFAGIEAVITGSSVLPTGVDGSLDIYSLVNGVKSLVWRYNGADNENNSFRPLDMNNNNIVTTSNFGLGATGGGYGLVGQSLVSGQGLGNRWNYNMAGASVAGTGGGSSLTGGTFTDIIGGLAISLPVGSIVISPVNKYRVTVDGTFSGVNDDVRMYMEIQASGAGAVATGQTYNSANDLYYYTTDVDFGGGGNHFTTFSFSDVFTCSLVAGGTATVNLWVEPGGGSHSIANNRHTVSIEPLYA